MSRLYFIYNLWILIFMDFLLQGSPFKLAGTFDRYYYKKYKSYRNFWYGDGKEILLEFRICPIFTDLTQIEGYRTVWSRFGCFFLRVTSNLEVVWGQYGLKNLLLCHYYSNTINIIAFFSYQYPMRPWMIYLQKYAD